MIFFTLLMAGCGVVSDGIPYPDADEIVRNARLDLLLDEVYLFPAVPISSRVLEYQAIRKWDVIFAGGGPPGASSASRVDLVIPGPYDHILVYLGKDARGFAYMVELTVDTLLGGDLRMFSLGQDYGENVSPAGRHVFSGHRFYEARRFTETARQAILAKDADLVGKVTTDLLNHFPYQFEYNWSGNFLDHAVYLVDDGRSGGAGCADYWTTLLEEVAGLCFYQSRISAAGIRDYFLNDAEGLQAKIPGILNPFGVDMAVRELFPLGFYLVEDKPHQYICGGNPESGLVIPSLVFQSSLFEPGGSLLNFTQLAAR